MSELKWDPSVTATQFSVAAKDGIVTLRGSVPHYFEKSTAEEASMIASEIEVVPGALRATLWWGLFWLVRHLRETPLQ